MDLFNPQTTALISIDLQGFILGRTLAPHTAEKVIENTAAIARHLKAADGTVILVTIGFSPDYADAVNQPVDEPTAFPAGGLSKAALAAPAGIAALDVDVHITKHHWSAFYGTELDLQLRRRGIKTVILAGVATNFGVESTVRDAYAHNYAVIVAEDAVTSMSAEMHDFSMAKVLPRLARICKTAEIIG